MIVGTMTTNGTLQSHSPPWLRSLGISSWLVVGFVLVIVGLIWLLAQTSTIVMPVIFAAVLGAVAGPAVGWLEHHRVPRIGGAILVLLGAGRHRRAHLLPRRRRDLQQLGGHLDQGQPRAGQGPGLARRRRRRGAGHQGGRPEGRARDPRDAAGRDRARHRRPEVGAVLPRVRGPQHAVRAQGRPGHARLHQPPPRRPGTGRRRRHGATSRSRCAATSSACRSSPPSTPW